jgi:Cu/Ag efflux protein CusF
MKKRSVVLILVLSLAAVFAACGGTGAGNVAPVAPSVTPSPSPAQSAATPVLPKNGVYPGKGVVTKINLKLGSVEIDHEAMPDVMPAMIMEFFVRDKAALNGLKLGDKVDFMLEYKDHTETIVKITKAQ